MLSFCPPPQRKTSGASSPLSGWKKPWGRLPNPESGRWIWWEREKIGDRPSSFPPPDPTAIPTSAATAPHRRNREGHRNEHRWRLTQLEKASDDMHTQWKNAPQAGSQLHQELTLRALLSIRQHADCVYPQKRKIFAWRNAQPVMQSALAQVLVLLYV